MVRNKLTDLTNTLFAQLETLDDRDLTDDELKAELQRSKTDGRNLGSNPSSWPVGARCRKIQRQGR